MPTALASANRVDAIAFETSRTSRGARRDATRLKTLQATCRQALHDLRAPLNAMTLNLDLVRQIVDDDTDRQAMRHVARERIAILQGEVTRLSRMLQTFAAGPPRREPDVFELGSLVRELSAFVAPQAQHLGIRIDLRLPDRPVAMKASRDDIERALLNLLMNALQSMPRGGPIHVDLDLDSAGAVLLIRDHGVGIAARHIERIFRPGFTTKPTGSGIGLVTARAAIEAFGGSLTLHSREGIGTTARITLPVAAAIAKEVACSMS